MPHFMSCLDPISRSLSTYLSMFLHSNVSPNGRLTICPFKVRSRAKEAAGFGREEWRRLSWKGGWGPLFAPSPLCLGGFSL